jgi:hypothetical protein
MLGKTLLGRLGRPDEVANDLGDPGDVRRAADLVFDRYRRYDVPVHAAAMVSMARMWQLSGVAGLTLQSRPSAWRDGAGAGSPAVAGARTATHPR